VAKWQADRARAQELQSVKERLATLEAKAASAERMGDYEKAADLKYGAIPDLRGHLHRMEREEAERKARKAEAGAANGGNADDDGDDDDSLVSEMVTPQDISEVISRWTGIPVARLSQTERERLLKLDERLKERVIGQDEAIRQVTDSILRSKAGLSRESQPTGSFLFLGPTGCGKTELAKSLFSELYDGDERHLIRIDMSEYTEPHSVSRLVGSPPGYVGHEEGGQLTEAVRRRPYTVVLFDEVEKAHPRVLTLLLQILDEGRLTDSKGRTVDFKNTVIILTSNLGAKHLLHAPLDDKRGRRLAKDRVMADVQSHFAPEFLNRLSAIVLFNRLGLEQLEKIVHKSMRGVRKRLAAHEGVRVVLEPSGAQAILAASYNPDYGARPVERYLEATVVTRLSRMLISGELHSGTIVHIEALPSPSDVDDGNDDSEDDASSAPSSKKARLSYRIERVEPTAAPASDDHSMHDGSWEHMEDEVEDLD
jgi:ATP-dependent Clp protease ATP-binding subunit ClpB